MASFSGSSRAVKESTPLVASRASEDGASVSAESSSLFARPRSSYIVGFTVVATACLLIGVGFISARHALLPTSDPVMETTTVHDTYAAYLTAHPEGTTCPTSIPSDMVSGWTSTCASASDKCGSDCALSIIDDISGLLRDKNMEVSCSTNDMVNMILACMSNNGGLALVMSLATCDAGDLASHAKGELPCH